MVSTIIELCARNRLLVFLGVGFLVVGAGYAIHNIKLDAIPDLSDPQVIVFTEWMGRSPTLVEDQVTYPIVAALVSAPHVTDVRGFSMFGMSFTYVVFEEGTDVYWARSRVLEYMNGIKARLPEGVAPVIGPDATGIGWVFQYALVDRSGKHGLDELRTFQDFTLRYALGSVPGVAEVASVGGYEKQYQVVIDPDKLRAYGVTLPEVIAAIRDSNNDVGGRAVEMSGREYYVRGRGYIQDIASVEQIAVKAVGASGTPVLVRDLGPPGGAVRFGPDIRRGLLEWNGEGEAVGGIVVMRYGENALDVIARVKKKLEDLRPSLPPGVEVAVAYDRSGLIERAIHTLEHSLVEEAITVSLIIILFLLHIRSSLLPIISLPIAVALSFIPMYLLDIPSTIMSLGGIAIAVGATVDAEIVMIEASHKKLEQAGPNIDAATRHRLLAEAAKEVTPAIFFSLLIIAVAFLPIFTLNGQAGRLFKPLAYTKTFVMLFSAVLSITLAPALRDYLIRGKIHSEKNHPVSKLIISIYKPFVFVALRRPKTTLAIGLFAILSSVPLALKLGHEFMPPLNEGDILYMPITFPNISIEEAKRQIQRMDRVLHDFPEVESVFGKVGRSESPTDPAPITMMETTVRLRPTDKWRTKHRERWYSSWAPSWMKPGLRPLWPEDRTLDFDELTGEMNQRMQFPGWTNAWTMPIKTRVDMLTTGVRTPIGIKVFGTNLDEIERLGVSLEHLIAPIRGTRSVLYERNLGALYLDIIPRREALARYGLRVGDVERVIESAIGGTTVSTTVEGRNRFSINVRYPQDLRSDVDRLKQVLVPVGGGGGTGGGGGSGEGMGPHGSQVVKTDVLYADNMPGAGSDDSVKAMGPPSPRLPLLGPMTDATATGHMPAPGGMRPGGAPMRPAMPPPPQGNSSSSAGPTQIPLGELADIRIVGGPPMVRDEGGLLVGYVYVDIDPAQRDIGGYVDEAKALVNHAVSDGNLALPAGYFFKWTGQYELLTQMVARMKIVVPLTLAIIVLLLFLHFRDFTQVLIVLLSIPFALVGSVWLLWLLDYRVSTAVWVGVIALVGLAAQTGIVMIVYIDHAYERRRAAGMIRDLDDIIWAHMEGTVLRVRPKLMTVSTMLFGLIPLLWATGSGADVMKRIAAPMVGGLFTSAFLTLEMIPVIYTYWRQEQVLQERLAGLDGKRLARMHAFTHVQRAGWGLLVAALLSLLYVNLPPLVLRGALVVAGAAILAGMGGYLALRTRARMQVWPT